MERDTPRSRANPPRSMIPRSPMPTTTRVLTTVAGVVPELRSRREREAELRDELARLPEVVATVPTFDTDVTDIAGLA